MCAVSPTDIVILGGKFKNNTSGNGIIYNINSEKQKKIKTSTSGFYTPFNQIGSLYKGQFFGLVYTNGACNLAVYESKARQNFNFKLIRAMD